MLKIEHLTKIYGEKRAVDDLSLNIGAGEIYAFIGHNGAGKTTTLKSCAGILKFDEGNIYVDGISIKKDPLACKKLMAYIPDNPDLYTFMTGIKYLNFIADAFNIPKDTRTEKFIKYAEIFSIKDNLNQPISEYSHGMKQKLAIIGALIHSPKLLVLDEPFVGLDPKASFELKKIMREMCEGGAAVFFSTHVLEVAEKLCNKIAIIKKGKLQVCGNTREVLDGASLESVFLAGENA